MNINAPENKAQHACQETAKTAASLLTTSDNNNIVYSNNLTQKINNINTNNTAQATFLSHNFNANNYHQHHQNHETGLEFILDAHINSQHNKDEDPPHLNNNFNRFEDDEDNFALPSDIIEYNDDVNDYLMNEKLQLFSINDQPEHQYAYQHSLRNYEMTTSGSYGAGGGNINNANNTNNSAVTKRHIDSFGENLDFHGLGPMLNQYPNKATSAASATFVNAEHQDNNLRNQNNILDENRSA